MPIENKFERKWGTFVTKWDRHTVCYVAAACKAAYHRDAVALLKAMAGHLGLSREDYDIRSNKAGIAVSGEITLHSDNVYVQIGEHGPGRHVMMIRGVEGRKDYTGMTNRFVTIARGGSGSALDVYREACEQARKAKAH